MPKRLLISFAHPDDESFGLGSVIGKYVAQGVEVTLICATNGDVGTVDPEHLNNHDSVASLRLAELECAAQVLGFKEVILFGYRDSGMMGTPENEHPDCLWQAPLEKVTQQIVEVIRRVQPHVIITFDPFGGYGHPDHIKMHRATLAAYQAVQSDPVHPQKLYYGAFPRILIRIGVFVMKLMGQDPRHAGRNHDLDFQAVLDATLPVHAKVDVSRYYEIGERASDCHASQGNPRRASLPTRLLARWLTRQASFTRADPPPKPGEPLERDLFAGIDAVR
jgi:LmbE family N-acetylglucosaminyl deacetylase